jgi:hypothetical protein
MVIAPVNGKRRLILASGNKIYASDGSPLEL